MHVGLVRRRFTERKGGAESYAVSTARALVRKGCRVTVFAERFDIGPEPSMEYVPVANINKRTFLTHLLFVRGLRRALRSHPVDVVLSMARADCADVYRSGDPLFLHWIGRHEPTPTDRMLGWLNPKQRSLLQLERRIFRSARIRRVIALSRMEARLMRRYYAVPQRKIRVLHNGVDTRRFNPSVRERRRVVRGRLGIDLRRPVALFVGMEFKRKGLAHAIDAVARTDALLLVAGAGREEPYRRRATRLGCERRVLFLGRHSPMEDLYGAADVFLLPTLYDPFCNAVMEAMACGLPVVVGEEAGAAEIVRRGESGFVIDNERDPAKTAGQLTTALEARDRMGREAARDAAGRTMERYAERLMALLNEARREEI